MEYRRIITWLCYLGLSFNLAWSQVLINGPLTHEKEALPGDSYEDVIEITNPSDIPQEVKIYQTDYLFYADGRILYGDPGKVPRSNANWIIFSPKRLTIAPKESVKVYYTVKVPANQKLTGTYWSMLMVERIPPESPESSQTKKDKLALGILQVFRYGIQIVTHISQTGSRNIKFLSSRLYKKDKFQYFELDVENTGERWLRTTMWLELYDLNGNFYGKFEGERLRIYPATSVRYTIDLSNVPNGTYKGLVIIDCGNNTVFGANFNLVIK